MSIMCTRGRQHMLPLLESFGKTHYPPWKKHNVLPGTDTTSSVQDTMSSLEPSLGKTHCPLWDRHIVLSRKDPLSCVESMNDIGKFMKGVHYRVLWRWPYEKQRENNGKSILSEASGSKLFWCMIHIHLSIFIYTYIHVRLGLANVHICCTLP